MYDQPWSPNRPITSPLFSRGSNTIEVTGEGTVSAAPTIAIIVLGAITENVSLTAAQKENASAVTNIIEALLKLSIPKENIQTTHYSIDIEYNYEDGKQIFRGYKVTHLLQLTIDKIDLTGLIVDTAVQNGANTVSNIQFTLAHPEIAYSNALSLAIKNSLFKATTIANTLGVTLHPAPFLVQEISRTQEPIPYPATSYAMSAATPIQPGELKITALIKANFTYI
ncbi:SIMPL domain-containing protein [Paenibacillus sp. GCM10027626]|uniref:SIMPL domain-containing protein n=1 Tax=Paenibacillus sp. GCM10027626 TaxID=3273411 RepID=UPI0036429481